MRLTRSTRFATFAFAAAMFIVPAGSAWVFNDMRIEAERSIYSDCIAHSLPPSASASERARLEPQCAAERDRRIHDDQAQDWGNWLASLCLSLFAAALFLGGAQLGREPDAAN